MRLKMITAAVCLTIGSTLPLNTTLANEHDALRQQVDALEQQLNELRRQLEQAHPTTVAAPDTTAAQPAHAQHRPRVDGDGVRPLRVGTVAAGNAFNPAISVILDGFYYNGKDGFMDAIEHATGFTNPHDHGDHDHGELSNGFNLGHTELTFTATVDPYFDAMLALGIGEHSIEIEEAWMQTRNLPGGLRLKGGKFLSGIGYLNSQHAHDWDFADMALPYQLIFGDHGLNETGLQLTWTPPTSIYTHFGVELLQGSNGGMANYEGARDYAHGRGARDMNGPRLTTAFAKFGPDLGHDHALQIGLFGGQSRLHQNLHGSRGEEGRSWFAGTDWVYRYDRGGAAGHGTLKLQGEYIYRVRDLSVVGSRDNDASHPLGQSRKEVQDAFYLQGVYGIAPRWTAGLRYERAGMTNRLGDRYPNATPAETDRITANLTWSPTEFSRLRLQAAQARVAHGDAGRAGQRERFNQFFLQYQMALGVHGAHGF